MKTKKILIAILILIVALLIGTVKVKAASVEIYPSKETAEVGEDISITAKFTAAAWNVKVSGNGISGSSYASQTSDLSETENVKTFKLDTSKAGTYTVSISGDITDANGETKEISKNCTVTVNEKPVTPKPKPEPEPQPEQTTEPEPEKPTVLEFTSVANKTMYLETSTNFRSEYRISSSNIIMKLPAGTEVVQTGISKTQSEGYTWSKIIYKGQTGYVINGNLTDTKPEEPQEKTPVEEPTEEIPVEEPTEEIPVEDPITHNENEVKDGLKSLEIEGLTLSPAFSPDVYEYRVIVKKDLSELAINAVPVTEGATITIAGNKNLQEGENLITIVVYNAQNEVEATYQITTNKSTLDLTETDRMLQEKNQQARINVIIFVTLLVVAIIALIVVMILKNRNELYQDENEEDYPNMQEFTENEQTVENIEKKSVKEENTQDEIEQEETQRPRREKRKGKHF